MKTENNIKIEIPQAVIDGVMRKLQECKMDLAPYLQELTKEQSVSFIKIGDKTKVVINNTQKVSNPESVIDFVTNVAFFKDETINSRLNPIHNLANFFGNQRNLKQ
ncbi:hypothetical protein [Flavobacterium luteum]|uniref:Uncharacterized protein n=1 Tax=Flavobacterium luteum TaxID=2026654 RepID=A0A7J5ADR5_9FLAO|nr:hypothetical protein [Flavobacterium luteum]KAB1155702.1 hypothetical protein F6464_09265 [Flavobacterium luteum]